jgi:TonB family protein
MSGRPAWEFFTVPPVGGPGAVARPATGWGRLWGALLASLALHAALLLTPYFGTSAAFRIAALGAPTLGPERILRARLMPASEAGTARLLAPAAGAGAPAAPARAAVGESPRLAERRSRGSDLLPVPAPTFYAAEQLTKRPRPLSEPNLYVAWDVARAVTGKVVLQVWVSALGNVDAVEVEQSNLPEPVSSTVAAAFRRLRFEPGEIEGRRVPALLRIEVSYSHGKVQP